MHCSEAFQRLLRKTFAESLGDVAKYLLPISQHKVGAVNFDCEIRWYTWKFVDTSTEFVGELDGFNSIKKKGFAMTAPSVSNTEAGLHPLERELRWTSVTFMKFKIKCK